MAIFNKKGQFNEFGEGLFIMFIATALLIGIVAYVLSTSIDDTSRTAKEMGDKQSQNVGNPLFVANADGLIQNGGIERIHMTMRLNHGINSIYYHDLRIVMFVNNDTLYYSYENSTGDPCNGLSMTGNSIFHIQPILKGDFYNAGQISKEDLITVCFAPDRQLLDYDHITIMVMPEQMNQVIIETDVPLLAVDNQYIQLYPN